MHTNIQNCFILYLCICSSEAKEVKDAVESHQKLIEDENDGASERKSAGGKRS